MDLYTAVLQVNSPAVRDSSAVLPVVLRGSSRGRCVLRARAAESLRPALLLTYLNRRERTGPRRAEQSRGRALLELDRKIEKMWSLAARSRPAAYRMACPAMRVAAGGNRPLHLTLVNVSFLARMAGARTHCCRGGWAAWAQGHQLLAYMCSFAARRALSSGATRHDARTIL